MNFQDELAFFLDYLGEIFTTPFGDLPDNDPTDEKVGRRHPRDRGAGAAQADPSTTILLRPRRHSFQLAKGQQSVLERIVIRKRKLLRLRHSQNVLYTDTFGRMMERGRPRGLPDCGSFYC